MSDSILPLRFNVQEVGKHVKSSKKRFTWEVSMNGRSHSIVLDFSFISGKVKVAVDRKVLLENQLPANTSFQYPFTLDGNSLNVIQQGQSFQLRINNKVFSHLYNQAKTNKQFKKYEEQVKDFKVNENQFQAKKLTLNIGGVGGGMKKKPKNQSSEGHAWNAFGEEQMTGFPNYFEGQSVSTASTSSKVEQAPSTRKVGNLLDEDSGLGLMQTSNQKGQNILDFEAELQNTPIQAQQVPTKAQQEFSTMQMMFQTMNLNPTAQQGQGSVVIDSSEVDFFSSAQEQKPQQTQGQVDFFSGVDNSTVGTGPQLLPVSEPQANNFNTMRYMFATNQGMGNSNNLQSSFNTSSKVQPAQNWNTQTNNQAINLGVSLGTNNGVSLNTGMNLNSQPVQQQINPNNFSTLQGLFATNAMGISQPNPTVNTSATQQQPVNNFSLNTQHFATQGVPTQGFGTSFNVNAQQFGTNLMGQQGFSQDLSFLQQQKPTVQQPVLTSSSPVVQQTPQINMNDFNSMQMLFKTNAVQPNIQQQAPIQPQTQKASSMDSFSQQFATMGASTTQSPSSLLMNTYGGSNNVANLSFDLSTSPQQFNTSVNPSSMMKKKTTAPPVIQATNASDLL